MKKSSFYAMMLSGILLASCTDNIYDSPRVETVQKEYARSFQELIGGPVSRTQDFVVAKQDSVSVTLAASGDVKIYTRNGQNSYQLVGHYEDLSAGTHMLKFDAPEDVVDFAVEAGCVVKKSAGEALSFNNTPFSRTYMKGEQEDVFSVFEENGDSIIKVFTIDEIKAFGDILPPGRITQDDGTITSSVERILNGYFDDEVHIDFKVQNDLTKVVRVYPVYWIAGFRHEFGIFTYTVDGEIDQKFPIYRSRLGDDVQVSYDEKKTWENATVTDSPIYAYYLSPTQRGNEYNDPVPTHVRSRGFRVTLPTDGQAYGFYIDVYPKTDTDPDTDKHYFEAAAPTYQWYSDAKFNSDDSFHAAFFEADVPGTNGTVKRTFLGFEDNIPWDRTTGEGGDEDLNDFMFIVEPEPTIIDHTEHEWILAAEDLGDLDDFDFNDVVVSVNKLAGQTTMKVKALAAGGTLPVWLTFNDNVVKPESLEDDGEFHSWFSGSNAAGEDGLYPMLNTGRSSKRDGMTATITGVAKTYSITQFSKPDPETGFNGFRLKVVREDGTYDYITLPAHDPENGLVGVAPQMMCLPGGWKWPKERVNMVEAYPLFGEWGTGYQTTLDWQKTYDAEKVISY